MLTVEQFVHLNLPQNRDWELHDGDVVEVPFPPIANRRIQTKLVGLLESVFTQAEVIFECPFQVGDRDARSADLAVISKDRAEVAVRKGILDGAPEMVVEVLTPLKSHIELKRYRQLCLKNGTALFLVLDPDDKTIDVFTKEAAYTVEDTLPLVLLGVDTAIPVAQIFQGLPATQDA